MIPVHTDRTAPVIGRMLKVGLAFYRRDIGVVRLAFRFRRGRQLRIHRVPEKVHRVASHVADLARTEVPEHVPLKAIRAGTSREIGGVIRMVRRRAEPQIVIKTLWRRAVTDWITGLADLPITPRISGLEITDGTITN